MNSRYGHPAADSVLTAIAAAMRVAEELCSSVRRTRFAAQAPTGSRVVEGVTVSVGMAVHTGPEPDVAALLWDADSALYAAKRSGGDATHTG